MAFFRRTFFTIKADIIGGIEFDGGGYFVRVPPDISISSGGTALDFLGGGAPEWLIVRGSVTGAINNVDPDSKLTILNAGSMSGDVQLGGADDVYRVVGQGAQEAGTVYGGDGDDVMVGGDEINRLFGDAGSDLLIGGDGDDDLRDVSDDASEFDIVIAGDGNDLVVLYGTNARVRLGDGDDELRAFGTDYGYPEGTLTVDAGAGNDILDLSGAGPTSVVDGGTGDDTFYVQDGIHTITTGSGADVFLPVTGEGEATITDISQDDVVDMTNTNFSTADEVLDAGMEVGDDYVVTTPDGLVMTFLDTTAAEFEAILVI